jgi:CRISPR-associated exonuclease Cas4
LTNSSGTERAWPEDELIPLSGLQHLVFCERQFALIHVERAWVENELTVEGRRLHEHVDETAVEVRGDVRIARGVPLRSLRLGLVGRADVVEFSKDEGGAPLRGCAGRWRPFPVEYKRGRPKSHRADEVQLCAQVLCLEEMLQVGIPRGALFYGRIRRRVEVEFDAELRSLVERAAARAHELLRLRQTPTVMREPKCDSCSLVDICRPEVLSRSARRFFDSAIRTALAAEGVGKGEDKS